jgi:hypothetical protein
MRINNKKKEYANQRKYNRMRVQYKVIKRLKKSQVVQKSNVIHKIMSCQHHLKNREKVGF